MNKKALLDLQLIKKIALAMIKDSQRIYGTSLSGIRNILSFNFDEEIIRFFNIISIISTYNRIFKKKAN